MRRRTAQIVVLTCAVVLLAWAVLITITLATMRIAGTD